MSRAPNPRREVTKAFSRCGRFFVALAFFLFPVAWPAATYDATYTASGFRTHPMHNQFQRFDDVQQYISLSWDHLTRSLDKCKTYEDQKIGDEQYLYFPADFQSLPAFQELVKDCRVRVERLPEVITSPNDVHLNKISKAGLL